MTDSSDARAVEGAIVYIPNSNFGTSTDRDGRFALPAPPGGEFDLAVSRVGYRRRTIRVSTGKGDTVALHIGLSPLPVLSPGVEILAERGGSPAPAFFPEGNERSWCAYGSETEIPVGILLTEKAMYMYALETAALDDGKYVRLWLLMHNGSDDTLLFDAPGDVRLNVTRGDKVYRDISVMHPAGATVGKAVRARLNIRPEAPEHAITTMASQKAIFDYAALIADLRKAGPGAPGSPYPWLGWLRAKEHPAGVNPAHLKEVFDKCTHVGYLGRYRLAPSTGVDGCLWYPVPGFAAANPEGAVGEAYSFRYEFIIQTPTGEERIAFNAH